MVQDVLDIQYIEAQASIKAQKSKDNYDSCIMLYIHIYHIKKVYYALIYFYNAVGR